MTLKAFSEKKYKQKKKNLGVVTPFNFFFHTKLPLLYPIRALSHFLYYSSYQHHHSLMRLPPWFLYTFLVSGVTPCYILTSENLEPLMSKNMSLLWFLVFYLTQYKFFLSQTLPENFMTSFSAFSFVTE